MNNQLSKEERHVFNVDIVEIIQDWVRTFSLKKLRIPTIKNNK